MACCPFVFWWSVEVIEDELDMRMGYRGFSSMSVGTRALVWKINCSMFCQIVRCSTDSDSTVKSEFVYKQ